MTVQIKPQGMPDFTFRFWRKELKMAEKNGQIQKCGARFDGYHSGWHNLVDSFDYADVPAEITHQQERFWPTNYKGVADGHRFQGHMLNGENLRYSVSVAGLFVYFVKIGDIWIVEQINISASDLSPNQKFNSLKLAVKIFNVLKSLPEFEKNIKDGNTEHKMISIKSLESKIEETEAEIAAKKAEVREMRKALFEERKRYGTKPT